MLGNNNGFAIARRADRIVDGLNVEKFVAADATDWQKIKVLSMESIDREPLAVSSVRNLGLALTKDHEAGKGQQLIRLAAKLSRRDLPTHFWLIQDYGRANDLSNVLLHVDQALRTKEAAGQKLIPALHAGLASSDLVKPMVQLLRTDPPWKKQFWTQIEKFPGSLSNIGDVLVGLQEAGTVVDPSVPESIINQLAYSGQYAKAYDIYRKVYGKKRLPNKPEYLSNADFSAMTEGTVFDWTVSQNASLEVFLDPQRKALSVNVFGSIGGVAASQVVELPAGTYRFSSKIDQWDSALKDALFVSLTCTELGAVQSQPALRINLDNEAINRQFTIPDPQCRYYVFQLMLQPPYRRDAMEILVSRMSIRRSGSANETGARDALVSN
ncbi:MAG: hypothetical protein C0471_15145 [Erythrobacter sp.]|nr:hypothetical protein [Erythrobacter sp.]